MNAQCGVSESEQTTIVSTDVRQTCGPNSASKLGVCPARQAWRRSTRPSRAPAAESRNKQGRGDSHQKHRSIGALGEQQSAVAAMSTPMLTPVWSTAAIQGRHERGHVSEAATPRRPIRRDPQRRHESKHEQLLPRLSEVRKAR